MVLSILNSSLVCELILVLVSVTVSIQVLGIGDHYTSSFQISKENGETCLPTFTQEQCIYMQTRKARIQNKLKAQRVKFENEKIALIDETNSLFKSAIEEQKSRLEMEKVILVDQLIALKKELNLLRQKAQKLRSNEQPYQRYQKAKNISRSVLDDPTFPVPNDTYNNKWQRTSNYDELGMGNVTKVRHLFIL